MKAFEYLQRSEWTQGALARDSEGEVVNLYSESAIAFCASGVIGKAYPNIVDRRAADVKLCDSLELSYRNSEDAVNAVIRWNDDPEVDKEEVMRGLKEADV